MTCQVVGARRLAAAAAGLAFAYALLMSGQAATPEAQSSPAAVPSHAVEQRALLDQYCVTCHNDRAKTGGVSFEGLTADSIAQQGEVFEKAVRKVRGRVMPPPGARQPDAAAADALVAFLETTLDHGEPRSPFTSLMP